METLILFRLTLIICFFADRTLVISCFGTSISICWNQQPESGHHSNIRKFFCGCVFFELGMMGHNDDDEDEEKESGDGGGERKKCR